MGGDCVLRRVGTGTWKGTLSGYTVLVCDDRSGDWFASVHHPRGWCQAMRRAGSLRAAARRARAWIEANPLP
jgi:hypothetical protein